MRKGAKKKSSSKLSVNEEVASTDTVETSSGAQLKQKPKRAPRKPKNVEVKPDSHQPSSDFITEVTATHSFGNNRSGSTSQQCSYHRWILCLNFVSIIVYGFRFGTNFDSQLTYTKPMCGNVK